MTQAFKEVFTLGHSTRSEQEFMEILQHFGIELLVDVRALPGSRRFPHFDQEPLRKALEAQGIGYVHAENLGGRRKAGPGSSLNGAWRNKSFRAYADYMQQAEFKEGVEMLLEAARTQTLVILCAEAVPWRCHRSLIADALLARGLQVTEIFSLSSARPHKLTSFAVLDGQNVTYPSSDSSPPGDDSLDS